VKGGLVLVWKGSRAGHYKPKNQMMKILAEAMGRG
jgi:hypothetical protein